MIVYVAGPLFSLAEREFNSAVAQELRRALHGCEIVLPQEECAPIFARGGSLSEVYHLCLASIDRSSVVVAMLDGADADSGTCVELGYAMSKGKLIVGVRTDPRGSEDRGVNAMVSNACTVLIVRNAAEVGVPEIAQEIARAVRAHLDVEGVEDAIGRRARRT